MLEHLLVCYLGMHAIAIQFSPTALCEAGVSVLLGIENCDVRLKATSWVERFSCFYGGNTCGNVLLIVVL